MFRVPIRRSPYLAALLTAVHLAAAATLIPLDIPLWPKVAVALAIVASLAQSLGRHALLIGRTALIAVELHEGDEAAVQTRDGAWHPARVLGTSYISPLLTVLNLRFDGRALARHILVLPDNVDAEDFRALRVLLRWGYRKAA